MRRTPGYNENSFLSLVPYANVVPATATGGQSAYAFMLANGWNGYGPTLGFAATTGNMNLYLPEQQRAGQHAVCATATASARSQGMRRYFVSDRDRAEAPKLGRLAGQRSAVIRRVGGLHGRYVHGRDLRPAGQPGPGRPTSMPPTPSRTGSAPRMFYTYEHLSSTSAGNTYTANSNTANVNGFTALSGNSGCDSYTTLQQRNNNNKIDPCLDWSSAHAGPRAHDRLHTGQEGREARPVRQPALLLGSRRQHHDWRELGEQPARVAGRARRHHCCLLHPGDVSADRAHRYHRSCA